MRSTGKKLSDHEDCIIHRLSRESSLEKKERDALAVQLGRFLRDARYHEEGREEHKLFAFLADVIPSGIVITDADRRIEWVNRAYTEMTGYSFEESVGRTPGELLQGNGIDRAKKERMSRQLAQKKPFTEELLNYRKNGTPFWIRISIAPKFDSGGKLQHYIGIQEDITGRKEAELEAVRNSKILETITNQAGFAVFLKDGEGRYLFVNPEFRKQFGLEDQSVLGQTVLELMDGPTANLLYNQDLEVLRTEKPILEEEIIQNREGPRYYTISKFPVTNVPGLAKGVAGIATDVTELKVAEEKIKNSEIRLNLAQRIAEIGSWELNLSTGELIWSDEIYHIFELNPEEFDPSYETFLELVHPDDREMVDRAYSESVKKNEKYQITHRLKFPDGHVKYVEEHGEHFYNEKDDITRTIGTVQDITARERNQQKLKQSLKEKQVLLSEIHHRVKNNLAVVSSLIQLQWMEEDNPEIADKLQDSFNRIKSIAGIHEQLYQTDRFASVDLCHNLDGLASDLIDTMQKETEIELVCNCESVELSMEQILPCSLIANEVITNAIKHAFKGYDRGRIEITLDEKKDRVELNIRDNGIGLSDEKIKQSKSLGMHLIETLVQQLDAEYGFHSSERGTCFHLAFEKAESSR